MTLQKFTAICAAFALIALATAGASPAGAASVDYVGFAWESGTLSPSNPGDELSIAAAVTQIDPLFEVDLGATEGTIFISGLISTGSFVDGGGNTVITYTGGDLELFADAAFNKDWGTNPANGTVPSTFVDGDLVFSGVFTSFVVVISPSGAGIFEGLLDGTGGSALSGPCSGCAYTFAGTFAAPTGAQIPAGYDLQIDGVLDVESTVSVETMNWGTVKQLYAPGR